MAAVQQISAKQVADLVTSLARGRTVAQTATRMHMAESVVEEIGRLNGYPNTVELNRASRALNKGLRNTLPEEDLETDVPVALASGSAPSDEVEDQEVNEPADEDVVLWRCVRRGCGYDLRGPRDAAQTDVVRLIELHKQTHRDEGTIVIPGPIHVGDHQGGKRPHDCAACRSEAVEPPVVVPGEVVEEYSSVAAAVDELLADGLVEVVAPAEESGSVGSYECPVDGCGFTLYWAGQSEDPEDDREVDDYIDQQIADHEASHRATVAHVPNGSTVPEALGAILATMGGQLAATQDSPGPLPSGEAVPDAADVATSEQHGVRDVEGPPVVAAARLDAAPRTIERLLDEAEATGNAGLAGMASGLRTLLQELADRLDRWVDHAEQRKAILHELDILGRRQDELTEKLARLDADSDPAPAPEVIQAPTLLAAAKADLAAAILEDHANETEPAVPLSRAEKIRQLPFMRMTKDARARCKEWAIENGLQVSPKGSQPNSTVNAYLAAHPEDDPR